MNSPQPRLPASAIRIYFAMNLETKLTMRWGTYFDSEDENDKTHFGTSRTKVQPQTSHYIHKLSSLALGTFLGPKVFVISLIAA